MMGEWRRIFESSSSGKLFYNIFVHVYLHGEMICGWIVRRDCPHRSFFIRQDLESVGCIDANDAEKLTHF